MVTISLPPKDTFGTLTATKIICPEFDTASGDMVFKRAGTAQLWLYLTRLRTLRSITLGSTANIEDTLGNPLIDPDDAGKIQTLAEIIDPVTLQSLIAEGAAGVRTPSLRDASGEVIGFDGSGNIDSLGVLEPAVETPDEAFVTTVPPFPNSWGVGVVHNEMSVTHNANGTFKFYLNANIVSKILNRVYYIKKVHIYYMTMANGDYINTTRVKSRSRGVDSAGTTTTLNTDYGNGTTGAGNYAVEIASGSRAFMYDKIHLEIDMIHTTGSVRIYGIDVYYTMTA